MAYASGRALRPHLDDEEEPVPLLAESVSGQMLLVRRLSEQTGSGVEHVNGKGVDALGWVTEDDTGIECWCEGTGTGYP
jgi:hypothetical protein